MIKLVSASYSWKFTVSIFFTLDALQGEGFVREYRPR